MMNDLTDTQYKKHKSLTQMNDNPLEDFPDNQTPSINNPTGITSPPPFDTNTIQILHTKRPNKLRLTRLKLFPKRQPLLQPIVNYRTSACLTRTTSNST